MRLAGIALIFSIAIQAQTTLLDQFVGRDLWENRPAKTQMDLLDQILAPVPKGQFSEPEPWRVWKTGHNERIRYVVLLREPQRLTPGGSSACIQLFDASAKKIHSWSFNTGWRRDIASASITFSTSLASDLIVLQMFAVGPAPDFDFRHFSLKSFDMGKQYYALKNDQLKFIRMDDDKGKIIPNDYIHPNIQVGIVPTADKLDDWIALLASEDKVDVLSALLFLGGQHVDKPMSRFPDIPWRSNYATLVAQLKSNRFIHEWIRRRSQSDDPWVKEAALRAAATP